MWFNVTESSSFWPMMSIQSPGFLPGNDRTTVIPNNRKRTAENLPGVLSKNNPIFPPFNNPAKSCLVKTCRMGWVALSREWGNETIHSYDGDSFPHSLLRASQLSIFELKIAVLCFLSASSSQTSEAESQAITRIEALTIFPVRFFAIRHLHSARLVSLDLGRSKTRPGAH